MKELFLTLCSLVLTNTNSLHKNFYFLTEAPGFI